MVSSWLVLALRLVPFSPQLSAWHVDPWQVFVEQQSKCVLIICSVPGAVLGLQGYRVTWA